MKYLLHIDTSTDTGIVAISAGGLLLAAQYNKETRNHAGTINILIADALASAQIIFSQLAGVVVCAGPGSYTGLRIGMATAKGICYALDIPIILHNRLSLLAYQAYQQYGGNHQFLALLKAREKEYFIAIYNEDYESILEPKHINETELAILMKNEEKILVVTNVEESVLKSMNFEGIKTEKEVAIDPVLWAKYVFSPFICNKNVKLSDSEPFYLKQVYTHN